jgi:Glu-tRNA(Gln) amidotransferase subunit E-like FAD-binding protein
MTLTPNFGGAIRAMHATLASQLLRIIVDCTMSKEQVKAILDRVLTWPEQRQEDAAKMLMLMESTDQSVYRLTDEQVAEVRRRIANPDRKLLSPTEARERILRLGS